MDYGFRAASCAKDNLSNAPNSKFKVGVFITTDNDFLTVAAGNIEHPNSALNMCAERLALMHVKTYKALPKYLYLVSDSNELTFPCGICRQYMSEFPNLKVTVYSADGSKKVTKTAKQLLPNPFIRGRK